MNKEGLYSVPPEENGPLQSVGKNEALVRELYPEKFSENPASKRSPQEIRKEEERKEALRAMLLSAYKNTDTNPDSRINKKEEELDLAYGRKGTPEEEKHFKEKRKRMFRRFRNVVVAGLGALALYGGKAKGSEGEGGKFKGGAGKGSIEMERVSTQPAGSMLVGKEGRKSIYRIKSIETEIASAVKGDGSKSDPEKYEKWLKVQLGNGISPEQLAKKGYISAREIPNYAKFYKENSIYVYTLDMDPGDIVPTKMDHSVKQQEPLIAEKKNTMPSPEVFNFKDAEEAYILLDDSPSMTDNKSKEFLANDLSKSTLDIPVHVVGFTDGEDTAVSLPSVHHAAEFLRTMRPVNKSSELALDVALSTSKKIKENPSKKSMIIVTDEGLQGVTEEKLAELASLSQEKHISVEFVVSLFEKNNGSASMVRTLHKFTLEDLQKKFKEDYSEVVQKRISDIAGSITTAENQLKDMKATVGNLGKKEAKVMEQSIKDTEDFILRRQKQLTDAPTITIDNFENMGGK